jgi:hypothetical protein
MLHLTATAVFSDIQQGTDAAGDLVREEDDLTIHMAGGTTSGLDQGGTTAKKPLFVRIQDADEAHLWKIEPLTEKVDADEDIEFPCPQ